ncbi:MAG: BT_3928 family protein [Bacteroidia bacterium]
MKIITQISRILTGALFIVSGLIKANDTIGFGIKLKEYFEVFDMPFFEPYAVAIAMVVCVFEIIAGVALLIGAYSKLNTWLLLILIIFFTWLTGYSAITNKVTDCGCFGDAIKLKPVESFMKDVVLLVLILIILFGIKHVKPIFNKGIEKLILFVALLVSSFFTGYTYMFLPYKDFLPYKVGNNIKELSIIPEGAPKDEYEMIFIYEKDGVHQEFTVDNIPDDESYKFVDRKDKLIKKGYKPPISDFKIYDGFGNELSDSFFNQTGYKLLLVQTKLEESRTAILPNISMLAQDWNKNQPNPIWALTSTSLSEAEAYKHANQLSVNYYNMDATPLKSMVRSNPGLILLKDNTVVKKWSAYNIPTYATLLKYIK